MFFRDIQAKSGMVGNYAGYRLKVVAYLIMISLLCKNL